MLRKNILPATIRLTMLNNYVSKTNLSEQIGSAIAREEVEVEEEIIANLSQLYGID